MILLQGAKLAVFGVVLGFWRSLGAHASARLNAF